MGQQLGTDVGMPVQVEGPAPPTPGRRGRRAVPARSVAFFDGAGSSGAVTVLVCWALVGTALVAAAALRHRKLPPR